MKRCESLAITCILLMQPLLAVAEKIDETRSVSADATVSVSNVAGEIIISVWERDEVHLTGSLGTNQELEVTENANGIRFEVIHNNDEDYDESLLHLLIPSRASIIANGVSADIEVAGSIGARINVDSVSGDVTVQADSERVEISTVSGELEFEGSSVRTAVKSVSGDIVVEGVTGELTVGTVSGDVELLADEIEQGKFQTVSGSLTLNMSVNEGGRLTIEGMSGDVDLFLPASQSGSFSAQTFSGDIDTDFGTPKNDSFGSGSRLKHSVGDSGTIIRVETFSGDIHIGHK